MAPLEAMACGLVPVCSDLPVFRDYLTDGETGLTYDYQSPTPEVKLAEKLIWLIDHPEKRSALSQNAIQKAREFSIDQVAANYLRLMRESRKSNASKAQRRKHANRS